MASLLAEAPATEKEAGRAELIRRFSDRASLTTLLQKAARDAVLDHKRDGVTVSSWEDGRLVITQPEDIVVPDEA